MTFDNGQGPLAPPPSLANIGRAVMLLAVKFASQEDQGNAVDFVALALDARDRELAEARAEVERLRVEAGRDKVEIRFRREVNAIAERDVLRARLDEACALLERFTHVGTGPTREAARFLAAPSPATPLSEPPVAAVCGRDYKDAWGTDMRCRLEVGHEALKGACPGATPPPPSGVTGEGPVLDRTTCAGYATEGCRSCGGDGWVRCVGHGFKGWRYCDCAVDAHRIDACRKAKPVATPAPTPSATGGASTGPLTFESFGRANRERCEAPSGFDRRLDSTRVDAWGLAICGEAGEIADALYAIDHNPKKGLTFADVLDEVADVVSYCDLMAQRLGTTLEACLVAKWNRVSEKRGYAGRLAPTPAPDDRERRARAEALREVADFLEERAAALGDVQGPMSSIAGALRDARYLILRRFAAAPPVPTEGT